MAYIGWMCRKCGCEYLLTEGKRGKICPLCGSTDVDVEYKVRTEKAKGEE